MSKLKLFVLLAILFGSIFLFVKFVHSANTDIVITEIGAYESSGHEWLEIFNKGEEAVDMKDWKFLENNTNHGLDLIQGEDMIIDPGEYVVIVQNDFNFLADYPDVTTTIFDSSWQTLSEDGENIALKDADEEIIEEFIYIASPDFSLERIDPENADYTEENWKIHPDSNTVGQKNYWYIGNGGSEANLPTEENKNPTAVISAIFSVYFNVSTTFDASFSSDEDGSISDYSWDFGDGESGVGVTVVHSYSSAGIFEITLTVTDDQGATESASQSVQVFDSISGEENSNVGQIVINEFVANPTDGESEWIELYNFSTSSIDLTGWTLNDGVGKIASPTSTVEASSFVVIKLSSSKLNNGGDMIVLKNLQDEIVDKVSYGDWDDGNKSDNAPDHEKGNSVARISDGQDTESDQNDFKETTTITKGLENIVTIPIVENEPSSPSSGGGATPQLPSIVYQPGDVVINELVSDPADDQSEFVEFYNKTASSIDLSGWWIEDGSETKTVLSGSISAKSFAIVESPKGNLNNSGDVVVLFDPSGKEIDRVTYGTWDDGNVSDNAPIAKDPMSLARKVDGQDADNDHYDFVLTTTITKGKTNVVSSITEDGEVIEQSVGSFNIILNEVFPNPSGSDNEDEFIELKNIGIETVDLTNWKLGDSTSKRYTIKQGTILPGSYLVFKRVMTGIALNNTGGDIVKLFFPNDTLTDSVEYVGSADEDESYARRLDNTWAWTTKITSGKENVVEGKSAAPIIAIDVDSEVAVGEPVMFDASDTTDPDGDKMDFKWDFGDGDSDDGDVVEHLFTEEGVFTVELIVLDSNNNETKKKVIITVKNKLSFNGGYYQIDDVEKIQISEALPNPIGSDTTEFIELYNPTTEDIDLSQLKIDDEEGGSRAYTIPDSTTIEAGKYLLFARQDTKLALNNTSDSVRLLYPNGEVIQDIRYDDVVEGASYIRDADEVWIWTGTPTPGEENIIAVPKSVKGVKITKGSSKYVKPTIETTLEKLRDEDIGDQVIVSGVVSVEPGVFGAQYMYIVSSAVSNTTTQTLIGSAGVQIYMYNKDFPKLEIGDRVQVAGEISESGGETRIKVKEKKDIEKIDHVGIPTPQPVETIDIGEQLEGWLVEVNGEITELKSSYMYVDDGTEEVKVYFKRGSGINTKVLQLGDIISVSGIISQTKTGYRLLPRSSQDIVKTGVAEDVVIQQDVQAKDQSKEVAEKYLTATAGGLTSVLFGLFVTSKGGRMKEILEKIKKMVKKK